MYGDKRKMDYDKDSRYRAKQQEINQQQQQQQEEEQQHYNNYNNYYTQDPYAKSMAMQAAAQNSQMMAGMQMPQPTQMQQGHPDDPNTNYYQEYCRLFIANVVLTTQMKELVAEKNELIARLAKLEKQHDMNVRSPRSSTGDSSEAKKKRERRKACEIDRHYLCPVEKCGKSYGSEGSMNQHLKNKHPELANDAEWRSHHLKKEGGLSPKKSDMKGEN
jgi:cell division protein FtsB